jgi:CubicO group peptidase (beta-lactamase class C family)
VYPFDEKFDTYVGTVLQDWKAPGVVFSVIKNGEYVFVKGYGTRRFGENVPVNNNTLITIASCTKSFTAAAVAMLVDEGKLFWDDPVKKHIPEFRFSTDFVTEKTTIRDILLHRSGLPGILGEFLSPDLGELMDPDLGKLLNPDYRISDLLRDLQTSKPVCGFREKCEYSQVGFALIGEVIRRVSGSSWRVFITQRILNPLGMSSSYADALSLEEKLGDSHNLENLFIPASRDGDVITSRWIGIGSIYATAGGVITTADDIVKWMELQLGEGMYNGTRLISVEAIHEMHTPQMIIDSIWETRWSTIVNPFAHLFALGLGWISYEYQGRKVVEHAGANFGSSVVALVPEEGLGIAVFANTSYPNWESERMVAALKLKAIDLLLGISPTDWSQVFLKVHNEELAQE